MSEVKITDLVDQESIDKIKELDKELQTLLDTYVVVAKEMAKGIHIQVKGLEDLERQERILAEGSKQYAEATTKLNSVVSQQNQLLDATSATISRELMERQRRNKLVREEYNDGEKVKQMVEEVTNSYSYNAQMMAKLDLQIKANKKSQQDLEKAYKSGKMSQDAYLEKQGELLAKGRQLSLEKSQLGQLMKVEEKLATDNAGSYNQLSHQLELLKKTYKDMSDVQKDSPMGQEFERAIQDLDAHLKDLSADMGEFQRNVGNYAIAGQNGVVSTESLIAALQQEAKTQQDLVDQTKILEEAKSRLDTSDANYAQNLSAVNSKLEENKRKITDVSDILGKEAKTVVEAEEQNKRLSEALKHIDVTSEGAKKKMEELRAQISKNNEMIAEATGSNEQFADSMLSLVGINSNFGSSFKSLETSGNFIDGLHTKVKAFGQTLLSMLANPWVISFLGLGGVVMAAKWIYDYNKGLMEASKLTENFTGATGKAADHITSYTQTLADTMGKGYKETIEGVNTLVQQFGLSWDEANRKIQDGIVAGADMSGNLLANIDRFAPAMRDAGVSADEFVAILAETRNGIFDEQGIQNIVKAGTRLRAMTTNTEKALDSVGISAKKMQEDLKDGNITMLDAVKQVASKLKELPENSQEAGEIMKNVFGRTASEGGTLLIQAIADINTNLDTAKENMGDMGKVTEENINAQHELSDTMAAVFKASGTSFEKMTTQAKTYLAKGLTAVIKGCVDIVNWFIEVYNEAINVRRCVATLVGIFKTLWTVAKSLFELLLSGFKNLGGVVEGVMLILSGKVSEGLDKITGSFSKGLEQLKNTVMNAGKEIGSNFGDEFSKAAERQLKPVKLELDDSAGKKTNANPTVTTTGNDLQDPEDNKSAGNANKAAEKAAKEELKRLQELEASKIEMMAEGHEKELATIRLNFRKKLDAITGNGETEQALRLQLAEQCDKEIADCELKYQQELAKVNLANRLALVKEGSKEELDYKLAQLEATKQEEIKAAKKSGADKLLIEEKFEQQKQKLREEYANKRVAKIEKEFADENEIREAALVTAVAKLKMQQKEELKACGENGAKREKIEKDYAYRIAKLQQDAAVQAANETIRMLQMIVEADNLSTEEREAAIRKLAKAQADLNNVLADAPDPPKKKAKMQEWLDENLGYINTFAQAAADMLNGVNDLMQTIFDAQIERIEALQEANEAAGEAEQEHISELVEKKVITQEEGEARKRAAEAKTAKKNEELEKKAQKLKIKQAKWDKANSIVQATIATALAITQALPNVFLAAIAGAMGALEIATIVATPIPQYAKGTDYHKGGPAIVGDGGRQEVIMYRGSAWLTPDIPTLVDIPEGASVVPSVDNMLRGMELVNMRNIEAYKSMRADRPVIPTYNDAKVCRLIAEQNMLIRAMTAEQRRSANKMEFEMYKRSKL